jgi:symplekin
LGTVPKSADNAPEKVLSYKQLESDGKTLMSRLLDAQASAHISAVNLMTCMQCVQRIARCRPIFVTDVISAFEALHANLPPTLAPSQVVLIVIFQKFENVQVSSVRKSLKMHLLALLAHPDSTDMYATITTLLTDLGATQAQVMKALPAGVAPPPPAYTDGAGGERGKRRKIGARVETGSGDVTKKARGGDDDDDDDEDFDKPSTSAESGDMRQIAISTTASFLQDRLSVQTVADLVLMSMVTLPDDMPPAFQSTYTPIAAAGTEVCRRI